MEYHKFARNSSRRCDTEFTGGLKVGVDFALEAKTVYLLWQNESDMKMSSRHLPGIASLKLWLEACFEDALLLRISCRASAEASA